jgi:hypothetical protein
MTDKMRATCEFFYGIPFDECDAFMQKSWEAAWKASRETLVIELPPPYPEPEEPEFGLDDSHMDAYHAANGMRHACSEFIKAVGLKVKT